MPPAGVEPTLANYLLHTGYKSAVLPLNYRGEKLGAGNRSRTDGLNFGKVTLYQLSYTRIIWYTVGESNPSYLRERRVS